MSNTELEKLKAEVNQSKVLVSIGSSSSFYTSMSISASASYIDDGEIWWESVEISGVQA